MIITVDVNNVSRDTDKYIVARLVDGELWYWGSWPEEDAARRVASQFENGIVVERKEQ